MALHLSGYRYWFTTVQQIFRVGFSRPVLRSSPEAKGFFRSRSSEDPADYAIVELHLADKVAIIHSHDYTTTNYSTTSESLYCQYYL